MKAAALYHLLQIRARKFEESAEPATITFLTEVRTSLDVSYANLAYRLDWSHAGRQHTLSVPAGAFHFYLAGDNAASLAARKQPSNYRATNWISATSVWRDVAAASGLALPLAPADISLGLTPASEGVSSGLSRLAVLGGPALAMMLLLVATGQPGGASIGLAALGATALADLLCAVPLSRDLTILEAVLIAVGAVAPFIRGAAPSPLIVWLFAGLISACLAERTIGGLSFALWLAAGAIGGVVSAHGWPAAVAVGVWFTTLSATALAAPTKLSRAGVAMFAVGLAGTLIVVRLAGAVIAPAVPMPAAGTGWYEIVDGMLAGGLLLGFVLWCMYGVLYRVVPWLSVLALGSFALAASVSREYQAVISAGAACGFTVFLGNRLVRTWWWSSSHPPKLIS